MAATTPFPKAYESAGRAAPAGRVAAWRLAGVAIIGIALTSFLFGTAWDIQWHPAVGRDRVLTPPHVLMLAGIMISGLTSLILVLLESWHARRSAAVNAANSTQFMGLFRAPSGLFFVGFGALLGVIAFPLDDYWHVLYGIDVTLWAPFHIMIISSVAMVGLGSMYMLAAELNRMAEGRAKTLTSIGFGALLALTFAILLLPIPQANVDEGLGKIGEYAITYYPILLALALPIATLLPARVMRLPWAATIVALIFMALRQALFLFVPWVMDLLVTAEGLTYRVGAPPETITPYSYPASLLAAALAVDAALLFARRRGGDGWRVLLAASAATAVLATFWDRPWAEQMPKSFPGLDTAALMLNTLPLTLVASLAGVGLAVLLGRGLASIRQ